MTKKTDKTPPEETAGHAAEPPRAEPVAEAPHAEPAAETPHAEPVAAVQAPEPAPVVEPPPPPPVRTPVTRGDLLPVLSAVGFIVLLLGLVVAWLNPYVPAQVRDADQRFATLDARLRQLEARPLPAPQSVTADIARLAARLEVLESRQNADPAQVAQRLDVMAGRIEGLTTRLQTGHDEAKQAIDALAARVGRLEGAENSAAAVSAKVNKVARLQDAAMALAEGKPIGELPNAPPALAKFAKAPPPTEAALRLSFPAAERAALAAEQPPLGNKPFVERAWDRMQALVTVKRGKDVVIGNSSAVVLGSAKAALDAGDLEKAVAALDGLADAPKKAMAPWMADAQALLAARAALAALAGQA